MCIRDRYGPAVPFLQDIVALGSHKGLEKTRYVNDKQITDHYAIIPTGQGINALSSLNHLASQVYDCLLYTSVSTNSRISRSLRTTMPRTQVMTRPTETTE